MYECILMSQNPDPHFFGRDIDKDLENGGYTTLNCDMPSKISTFECTIKVTGESNSTFTNWNYAILKNTLTNEKKYYIIKNIERVSSGILILTLRADLLTQYESGVLSLSGKIVRSFANLIDPNRDIPNQIDPVNSLVKTKVTDMMYLEDGYGSKMKGNLLPFNSTYKKNPLSILVTAGKPGNDPTNVYHPGLCHMYAIYNAGPISSVLYSENFAEILKNQYMDPQSFILDYFYLPIELKGTKRVGEYIFPVLGRLEMEGMDGYLLEKRYQEYFLGNFVDVYIGGSTNIPIKDKESERIYASRQPFTEYSIYLPFLGFRTLDMDLCGYKFSLFLNVDYLTGNFAYSIYNQPYDTAQNAKPQQKDMLPVYRWEGNMAQRIPVCGTKQNINLSGLAASSASTAAGIATGNAALAAGGIIGGAGAAIDSQTTQAQKIISTSSNGYWGEFSSYEPYVLVTRPSNFYVNINSNPAFDIGTPFGYLDGRNGSANDALVRGVGAFILTDIVGGPIGATLEETEEIKKLLGEGVIYKQRKSNDIY